MARRFRTYRFELRPTADQSIALARAAGARRFVFNWALAEWRAHYASYRESPTRADLCRRLTALRHRPGNEWMLDVSSALMQQAITDVWRAYQNFFAGRAGYPRFKSKKRDHPRFRYPAGARVDQNRIFLPRIGWVRLRLSRPIDGKLKSVTVKRRAERWFVLPLTEFEIDEASPRVDDASLVVGIDLGLTRLATISDGTSVDPPRFAARDARRIQRASRALHRKQRGSHNRRRQQRRLAAMHARVAARRKDFLHKLTTCLANKYSGFCVETLERPRTCENQAVQGCPGCEPWRAPSPARVQGRLAAEAIRCCGSVLSVNEDLRNLRSDQCQAHALGARLDMRLRCQSRPRLQCGAEHPRGRSSPLSGRGARGHCNACGAQVRPRIEAQGVEAGTSLRGCQTGSIPV